MNDSKAATTIKTLVFTSKVVDGYSMISTMKTAAYGHARTETEHAANRMSYARCKDITELSSFIMQWQNDTMRAKIHEESILKGLLLPKIRHITELNVLLEVSNATNKSYDDLITDLSRFAAKFTSEKAIREKKSLNKLLWGTDCVEPN